MIFQKARLEALKRRLKLDDSGVSPDAPIFNMDLWLDHEDAVPSGDPVMRITPDGKCEFVQEGSCQTAACALGTATIMPEFQALGLTVDMYGTPEFKGKSGFAAGRTFFGITASESEFLFNPDEYRGDDEDGDTITRSEVIKHINKVLRDRR